MTLLTINSVDFTSKVIQKSYSVQRHDVYESWTDGNRKERRAVSRQRVTGSFKMTFLSETDYTAFLTAIAAVKTSDGYCPVQVWVNNDKELASINAFVDFETKHRWTTAAFGGDPELAAVTVKITER